MLVKLWMTSPPVTVGPGMTIGQAAVLMARRHIRRLLVVDPGSESGRLQGIVTLTDVARAFPEDLNPLSPAAGSAPPLPVREVMTRQPHTVEPTTSIAEAASILGEKKVGALPVVLGPRAVGIVTESDVFRAIVEMSGVRRPGTSITVRLLPEDTPMEVAHLASAAGLAVESFFCMKVDGHRTMTLRAPGRIPTDVVQALARGGRPVLDVRPAAVG